MATTTMSKKSITLSYGAFALIVLSALVIGISSGLLAVYVLDHPTIAAREERAWIGITYVPITPGLATRRGLSVTVGALVVSIAPNSPAASAGLRENDVITAIDGRKIDESTSPTDLLMARKPGDHMLLTILRQGNEQVVAITLGQLSAGGFATQNRSPLDRLRRGIERLLGRH